jgi:hypothetical protein
MADNLDILPTADVSNNNDSDKKLLNAQFGIPQQPVASKSSGNWKSQLKLVGLSALVFFVFSLPFLDGFISMIPGCKNSMAVASVKTFLFAAVVFLMVRYL